MCTDELELVGDGDIVNIEEGGIIVPVAKVAETADVGHGRSFNKLLSDSIELVFVLDRVEGIDTGLEGVLEEVPRVGASEERHSYDVRGRSSVDHGLDRERG